jgi:hypothetical protein
MNTVGGTEFTNHGHITTTGAGGGFLALGGSNIIRNTGTIDVSNGAFMLDGTGGDELRNAGTLTDKALSVIFHGGGADTLINTGHIDGNVVFGSGQTPFAA